MVATELSGRQVDGLEEVATNGLYVCVGLLRETKMASHPGLRPR